MFWVWLIVPLTGCLWMPFALKKWWEKCGKSRLSRDQGSKQRQKTWKRDFNNWTSLAPQLHLHVFFLLFSLSFSIPLSLSLWHFSFSASCLSIMFFSCWKSSHTTSNSQFWFPMGYHLTTGRLEALIFHGESLPTIPIHHNLYHKHDKINKTSVKRKPMTFKLCVQSTKNASLV